MTSVKRLLLELHQRLDVLPETLQVGNLEVPVSLQ